MDQMREMRGLSELHAGTWDNFSIGQLAITLCVLRGPGPSPLGVGGRLDILLPRRHAFSFVPSLLAHPYP